MNFLERTRRIELDETLGAIAQSIRTHEAYGERALLVSVVGGGAVGKSTIICPALSAYLPNSVILSEDDYCIGSTASAKLHGGKPHLLTPQDYQPERIAADLDTLRRKRPVDIPQYNFVHRAPFAYTRTIQPVDVVIMEGAYLLQPALRGEFDVAVFVDSNAHDRFARTIIRPRRNPAQSDGSRLEQYIERTYPSYANETERFRFSADFTTTNPYTSAEGFKKLQPIAEVGTLGPGELYSHPSMSAEEELHLTICTEGIQQVCYTPNRSVPEKHLKFRVPLTEYVLDLTRIGYSRQEDTQDIL